MQLKLWAGQLVQQLALPTSWPVPVALNRVSLCALSLCALSLHARGLRVDAGLRLRRHLRLRNDVMDVVVMMMRSERNLQRVLADVLRERRRSKSEAKDKRAEAEGGAVIHV